MFDLMQGHMIMQGKYHVMTGWIISCSSGPKRANFSSTTGFKIWSDSELEYKRIHF